MIMMMMMMIMIMIMMIIMEALSHEAGAAAELVASNKVVR